MALSKQAFGQMLRASAHSDWPMDEEVLREIAEERGDDSNRVIEIHREERAFYLKKQADEAEPTPLIVS